MELKNGWKRRSLLDSIIFRLYVKLWGCMVKTSRLWQTTKYIHYPHWSIRDLRGSTVSAVLDWEIHPAHHPCLRMPPPNWIKMSLPLSLDLHKSINWKKNHWSFVKFYQLQRLREATKWTHGQKRTSDSFVSIFFKIIFLQRYCCLYRNHPWFLTRIIGSLLPITTSPFELFWWFFQFPDNNSESLECPRAVSLSSIWYLATRGTSRTTRTKKTTWSSKAFTTILVEKNYCTPKCY